MSECAPAPSYSSFLVRFVLERPSVEPRSAWQASVEHVQSGERLEFAEPDRLLQFLLDHAGAIRL